MRYLVFRLLAVAFLLSSCGEESVYEEYKDFPQARWMADSVVSFSFVINDPTKPHDIYYGVRNGAAYPYYNLYVNYELSDPSGKILQNHVREDTLMDPQTGEPYGEGLGDLFSHQFPLLKNYKFEKSGTYRLRLQQFMRLDTLPEITGAGIRVVHTEE